MTAAVTDHPPRAFPIRLTPRPGESLDSWVAAYAARLQTPVQQLTGTLGLGARFLAQPAADIAAGDHLNEAENLLRAAGLSADQAAAMWEPLARYTAVVEAHVATPWLRRAVKPLRWSRYCAACLQDTEGRWQAAWRLPWHVACPLHRSLLHATCPGCDDHQRRTLPQATNPHSPTHCQGHRHRSDQQHHRCTHDLRTTPSAPAPAGVLQLQDRLGPLLEPATTDTDMSSLVALITDVLTVARHLDGPKALDGHGDTDTPAAALGAAYLALSETNGERLTALALADVRARPHPLPRTWHTASPVLTTRILHIRDSRLRPTDRIRWRTTTTGNRPTATIPDNRVRWVPTALWADWAVRLRPPSTDPATFAKVAAATLLIPGATCSLTALLSAWTGDPTLVRTASYVLQTVAADDHGSDVLRALTQLSDGLLRHGGPIDYQRREQLAAAPLLLEPVAWDRMCAASGIRTGGARKLRFAQLWTWEAITGGALERAPDRLRLCEPNDLAGYHAFALGMPPMAAELLSAHARALLDEHGCEQEPLTWSPPTDWADLDGLPGRDPAAISADQVGSLLRLGAPPTEVAQQLGTTLDHIRLVVRQQPPHLTPRSTGTRPTPIRRPFPAELTPERLHQLVVTEGRTLRSIRTEYGTGKHALRQAVERDGVPIPPAGRTSKVTADEAWLRRQYLEGHRTLPDLAAELGTSPTNLSRIAHGYGIPLRRRGGASHAASLTAPDGWPQPLAAAVLGQGGTERVKRFQVYARARSLNQAAQLLSTTGSVLHTQLGILERSCGAALLTRSTRRQEPQQPTPLGRRLLEQADAHLGPHPDAPPPLPEPLGSAIAAFCGLERLRRLQAAARARTLVDAAVALGTDAHSLNTSIKGLEAACHGLLLDRQQVRAPHHLTPLGEQLLQQGETFLRG